MKKILSGLLALTMLVCLLAGLFVFGLDSLFGLLNTLLFK